MSHVLLVVRQGNKIRRRRWDKMIIKCVFFFFFSFVVFQIGLSSSSVDDSLNRHLVVVSSPPRKALVYGTAPFRGPLSSEDEDDIYGDDKRVVHTGPNPLHN